MSKNYGLDLSREVHDRSPKDWILGATSYACLAEIPLKERDRHLPDGEAQKGKEDFMDCVTRGYLNILETKFNFLAKNGLINEHIVFLQNYSYFNKDGEFEVSDRFIDVKSGTTRKGNSMKAPADAIHRYGVIPKSMLPANTKMTWDDYHNPKAITKEMEDLGKEFLSRFNINYERVYEPQYSSLLPVDMLNVAGYAWIKKGDEYVAPQGLPPNHAFMMYNKPDYIIFDNYTDKKRYIKKLSPDYDFLDYGYRIFISFNTNMKLVDSIKEIIRAVFKLIADLFKTLTPKEQEEIINQVNINLEKIKTPMYEQLSNKEKLLALAKQSFETDISPQNKAPQELSCAEGVSELLNAIVGKFPIQISTAELKKQMDNDNRFWRVINPKMGQIIVSPRTNTTAGHAGIFISDTQIASNDSRDGKFRVNYTWDSWVKEFKTRRGLRIFLYEMV